MTQLILGTAEFGKAYGEGIRQKPSDEEVRDILSLAWESGIRTLDTAESYGCRDLLNRYGRQFSRMDKCRDLPACMTQGSFYHYQPNEITLRVPRASIYSIDQLTPLLTDVIIPVSINNTTFLSVRGSWPGTVYFRSVFDRGTLLRTFSVRDCLEFVMKYRNDGVIVGVNHVQELEDILLAWKSLGGGTGSGN